MVTVRGAGASNGIRAKAPMIRKIVVAYLMVGLIYCVARNIFAEAKGAPMSARAVVMAKDLPVEDRAIGLIWSVGLPVFAWPLDLLLMSSVMPRRTSAQP